MGKEEDFIGKHSIGMINVLLMTLNNILIITTEYLVTYKILEFFHHQSSAHTQIYSL